MKTVTLLAVSLMALTGCVSQKDLARTQDLDNRLSQARSDASATCTSKPMCDKAFSLTKVYVQQNADMKVQLSDDTMITTYNPTDWGLIALNATKVPGVGESATIQLKASCKGINDAYFFIRCADRMIPIYNGFKEYVELRLK